MISTEKWNSFQKLLSEVAYGLLTEKSTTTIYHYSRLDEEDIVLDPNYEKQFYSRREFETASTPRIFFYADPSQKERFFASSNLYSTEVPSDQIYNLTADPEGYVKKHRHPTYGLRKMMEWDIMLEDIRDSFGGIFYSTANFDVVAWFQPIKVDRVPAEEQQRLEEK